MKNKRLTRQEYNRLILQHLSNLVEAYPEERFGQLLYNIGVVRKNSSGAVQDPFYEESATTYNEMYQKTDPPSPPEEYVMSVTPSQLELLQDAWVRYNGDDSKSYSLDGIHYFQAVLNAE